MNVNGKVKLPETNMTVFLEIRNSIGF